MTPDITLIILAVGSFISPVIGFFIYLIFNSGTAGFMEKLEIFNGYILSVSSLNVGYIMAIFSLFLKKPHIRSIKRRLSGIGMLIWALTLVILISRLQKLDTYDFRNIIYQVLACFIWAPLFAAFLKLDTHRWELCRNQIIFMSAVTAFLTILIIVTKNKFLYQTLFIGRDSLRPRAPIDYTVSRVTVPGLWTLVPLGFWLSVEKLFSQQKQKRLENFFYKICAAIIFVAILFNLSRNMILGIICGTIFFVTMFFLFRKGYVVKLRVIILILLFVIVTIVMMYSFERLYSQWVERINRLVSIREDASINSRMECNKYMLNKLMHDVPLLGYKQIWVYNPRNDIGDPHGLLTMWWDYGFIACLIFIAILLTVFVKLAKVIVSGKYYPQEAINQAVFLMAYYFQYQFSMASGDYLAPDYIFPLVFFLAYADRVSQWQKQTTAVY